MRRHAALPVQPSLARKSPCSEREKRLLRRGGEWSLEIYLVLDVKDVKDVVDRGLIRHNPSVVNARVGVSSVRVGGILLWLDCIKHLCRRCLKRVSLVSEDRPWVEQAGYGFPWRLKDGPPTAVVHYCTCFTLPRLTTDTPLPGVCDTQHPLSCSRRPILLLQLTPATETSPPKTAFPSLWPVHTVPLAHEPK